MQFLKNLMSKHPLSSHVQHGDHHHSDEHDDTHHHNNSDTGHNHDNHQHGNAFAVPFFLILVFAIIEFFGGIFTQSLALLGDAGHMISDVLALGMAWYASHYASKSSSTKHASGLTHNELYASIVNCILMIAVTVYLVFEAIDRLKTPQNVTGGYVMLIAFVGLLVNLQVAKMLHHHGEAHGSKDNLNHRAAFLHVLGDVLGSVAALAAGAVIYFTGWLAADPLLTLFISVLILVVTLKLAKDIWLTFKSS
jgi:cobalt-zinc-cadmium efflux system protein